MSASGKERGCNCTNIDYEREVGKYEQDGKIESGKCNEKRMGNAKGM